MKYLLKGLYYSLIFFIFVIGCILQFLWGLKRPTLSLEKTFENGENILKDWGSGDDGY